MTFLPGAISDVKPGQTIFLNGMTDGQNLIPNAFAVGMDAPRHRFKAKRADLHAGTPLLLFHQNGVTPILTGRPIGTKRVAIREAD